MTEFYVIIQKRADGVVYADLHKAHTDGLGRMYAFFDREDAEQVFGLLEALVQRHYHIVRLVAEVPHESA